MPKFEAKSGKSTDCAFKLFGRTIAVKSSSESCIDVEENSAEHAEANEEKVALKRPTKVVACPRCESMDTKFCYFNNYNVNQPRHYCRKCQRYWTAGGAQRNVPVGAGRRKSKPSFGFHQGNFIEVSENVWTAGQPCIPLCPSGNSDRLVKIESIYPELRIFDHALNGAEAAHAQGKPKPQSQLDVYSHRLNLPSEKSVKEGCNCKHVGVGLCWIELQEKCTHLGKGIGNDHIEKPSCSSNDKTQLSATKTESSSEVVQAMDDVACDSSISLNAMVSAAPISEPQNMSPNDFSSSSTLPSPSSVRVIGNPWPVYYNGCWVSKPSSTSGIWGVQHKTNDVPWCPPGTGPLPAVNWSVPLSSMWGQQWNLPSKAFDVESQQKILGKHERDESPHESTGDRFLRTPKTQRINDPAQALRNSFVENLEKTKQDLSNQEEFLKHFNPRLGK